jgi:ribonucleotide reductase alpha subunit
MSDISVTKRNGKLEPLNYEKIHSVLYWATEGLKKVSVSDIEMKAKLQLYDKMPTRDIHRALIQSAQDLISPKKSNYQYVAARLLNYYLRKEIYNTAKDMPSLEDVIKQNVEAGVYDSQILDKYTTEDMDVLNDYIKHDRDFKFAYGGLKQLIDKYLLKDRKKGVTYETPQFMYMIIAMTLFQDYKKNGHRYNLIRKFYNDISLHKLSLPTPIMCGVRTPNRQYSSCTLIDVGDSLDSIFSSDHAIGSYTAKRAGIGLNCGRIRGIGAKIRGGEVVHTGVIPFLKKFEKTTRCCTQNGVRGGNSTTHFPFWHQEIEDILVLKNNKGTDDNRVRKMDYSIQLSRLFYKRFIEDKEISLFSPHKVQDLYEAFGYDSAKFEELYLKYEKDKSVVAGTIRARKLLNILIQERVGTGRIYIMNIDHCNDHSAFKDKINMSNLCLTGDTVVDILINGTPLKARLDMVVGMGHFISDMENEGEFAEGDVEIKILSKNVDNEKIEYKKILAVALTGIDKEVLKITDEETGKSVICTPEHKIYTRNRSYVMAKELNKDDVLDLSKEECYERSYRSLRIERLTNTENVYDLTVEGNHNFYANDILVHNCQEILLPTSPIQHIDDNDKGEIALCVLSAINVGKIEDLNQLEDVCLNAVRALDYVVENQDYPVKAATKMLKRRSLGIGITNLAYYFAKNKVRYEDKEALVLIDELMEHIQYYCIKASVQLAKELGPCEWFGRTKYSEGILPIDTYNKNVDNLVSREHSLDWESLRSDVLEHGMRNSCLTALMPCESSSVVTNSTNGIEPPRDFLTAKKSKQGVLKILVPEVDKIGHHYTLAYEMENNIGYTNVVAVIQKWIDQSVSSNHYYDFTKFEDMEMPLSLVAKDLLYAYQYGVKTLYYANSNDGKNDDSDEEDCAGGGCSV